MMRRALWFTFNNYESPVMNLKLYQLWPAVGLESVYVMTTAVVSTASLVCAPHQPFHREVTISLYSQNYLVSDSQVLFLYY